MTPNDKWAHAYNAGAAAAHKQLEDRLAAAVAALNGAKKLAQPWMDGDITHDDWEAAWAAIDAAIAKAEGK